MLFFIIHSITKLIGHLVKVNILKTLSKQSGTSIFVPHTFITLNTEDTKLLKYLTLNTFLRLFGGKFELVQVLNFQISLKNEQKKTMRWKNFVWS